MTLGHPSALMDLPLDDQVEALAWSFARSECESLASVSQHPATQRDAINLHNASRRKKSETDEGKMADVNNWLED